MSIKGEMRKYLIRVKYYSPFFFQRKGNGIYLIMDENHGQKHPGLVDRIKAIVGIFYIAQQNNQPFYLLHNASFRMEDYLCPNKINWVCDNSDLSRSFWNTELFRYTMPFSSIPALSRTDIQYHCIQYEGKNILELLDVPEWQRIWRNCFWQLFKPSKKILKGIEEKKPQQKYMSVHTRFVNALENTEKSNYNTGLNQLEKERLIRKVLDTIHEIENNGIRALVFSDSKTFLQAAEEDGLLVLGAKDVGHVTFSNDEQIIFKAFIDLFIMSQGEEVYSIQGNVLYASAFSKYAAIIGDRDYHVIYI